MPSKPITCHECDARWYGLRMEHCTVCHKTFSGATSGDTHRVVDRVEPQETFFRCLTTDELIAYESKSGKKFWEDNGVWHFGERMSYERFQAIQSGSRPPDVRNDEDEPAGR